MLTFIYLFGCIPKHLTSLKGKYGGLQEMLKLSDHLADTWQRK